MTAKKTESQYYLYTDAGYRVMRLHGLDPKGNCECGNPECKAKLKHPFSSNWQKSPFWSEEQLDNMNEMGWLDNFGVLIDDHLIIDIDPRNGGMDSYHQLVKDTGIDYMRESGFLVETGGGGWHIYFKEDSGKAFKAALPEYPGIDFKTSGFVVGASSRHASGQYYQMDKGDPSDLVDAPSLLTDLLKKSDYHRGTVGSEDLDISNEQLKDMLSYVDNKNDGLDYEEWIQIGMALHHTTSGSEEGFSLWDKWSTDSDKYDPGAMFYKWKSFGKSANPVTLGTLYHSAERGGYIAPVTFNLPVTYSEELEATSQKPSKHHQDEFLTEPECPIDLSNIDITSPPENTLVKSLADHIKTNLRRKRDFLAVMASLSVVGNLAGLRYTDEAKTTTNAFWFGVGDSGTGKDGVISKCHEVYQRLGLGDAMHGRIKSEQEVMRNLVYHQPSWYVIDEFGKFLRKLKNAEEKGNTSYLESVAAILMDAYSKNNSALGVSGDMKRDMQTMNTKSLKLVESQLDEGYTDIKYIDFNGQEQLIKADKQKQDDERARVQLRQNKQHLKIGIKKPFVSIVGLSTSSGFDEYFSHEAVLDGFMGRMIIFRETDSAPPMRKDYKGEEMPMQLIASLSSLFYGGNFSQVGENERIQNYNQKVVVPSTSEAAKAMIELNDYFDDLARFFQSTNSFEALALRAMEAVRKISLILAAPSGLRELSHVEYATKLVMHDIDTKIQMVIHHTGKDSKQDAEKGNAMVAKILNCANSTPLTKSVIIQKSESKNFSKKQCTECFDFLLANGQLIEVVGEKARNGRIPIKYKKA